MQFESSVTCILLFFTITVTIHSSCCTRPRSTGNVTLANLDCSSANTNKIVDCSYVLVQGSSSSGCNINQESIVGCFVYGIFIRVHDDLSLRNNRQDTIM